MRFVKILLLLCVYSFSCFGSDILQTLSLEEKVGQVLMVHFNGETANENARRLIQETKVGGIIYYNWSNGLHSPEQILKLSGGIQQLAMENRIAIPLLIATDQEGGRVCRLKNGFTVFPGNQAVGLLGDPNLAKDIADVMGREMLEVGINMNLAPVVDVNSNLLNPVIGDRSFSEDAQIVLTFGQKALEGYKQAGILSTLKHFPGHGDVEIDSHEDLPIIHKSLEDLKKVELLPFAGLAAEADAIMTAHILVPALDGEHCATLSEKTLTYLREEVGFHGVIISDSLVMKGVLKKCQTVDEAAIQALIAGCDMLILGGKTLTGGKTDLELNVDDVMLIHHSIVTAVKTGRISEARLDAAVESILKLKSFRLR